MISYVKLVSIPVRDQEKALQFYTEKLGFKLITDVAFNGDMRWIELLPPEGQTKVVLFTPNGQEDRIGTFSNVVFTCKDIQKTFQKMKERGVEFTTDLTEESWGTYAQFVDLDGNQFVLSSETK